MSSSPEVAGPTLRARATPPRRWRPTWAVVVAALGCALTSVPLLYGIRILVEHGLSTAGESGFAVAIGQVALAASLIVLAPLGWFLARGGRVPFVLGSTLVVLGLAYWATLGF